MLKLTELDFLREIKFHLNSFGTGTKERNWSNRLNLIIEKYELVTRKIQSKAKPLLDGEVYELRIMKGLSIREVMTEIYKRRGVKYSRSTIEKAIRLENLIGKGKQAELYKKKIENSLLGKQDFEDSKREKDSE